MRLYLYIRSCMVSNSLCTIAYTIIHGHGILVSFFKDLKSYTAFTDTLEWPECNSDKATVGSVVCTVYTDGQPYKPCILCETGLSSPWVSYRAKLKAYQEVFSG